MGDEARDKKEPPRGARVFGYLVAVAVNAAMLWCAWRILDWGWLPFLTDEWRQVLPVMTASFGATIAVNLGYLAYDPPWLRSAAGIVLLGVSIAVTVQLLRVFPFDFTPYEFPWDTLARVLLWLAIVGAAIGIVSELVKLGRLAGQPPAPLPPVTQPPAV